jgi:hypothetical protein
MHLHGNANDDIRKNARCNAAMQIRADSTSPRLRGEVDRVAVG